MGRAVYSGSASDLTTPNVKNIMRKASIDEQFQAEAERLALLPVEDQREIIALYRSIAENPRVPKREREAGMKRIDVLERLLGLASRKRKKR
jgi:hypothetical protein